MDLNVFMPKVNLNLRQPVHSIKISRTLYILGLNHTNVQRLSCCHVMHVMCCTGQCGLKMCLLKHQIFSTFDISSLFLTQHLTQGHQLFSGFMQQAKNVFIHMQQ